MASYLSKAHERQWSAIKKGMNENKRYFQLIYAMTNNDWATKIGISFDPLKRAEQIGFNIRDPKFRIAMFAIPYNMAYNSRKSASWHVEHTAQWFAIRIERRNNKDHMKKSNGIYRPFVEPFGFRMRSGGTEVYGITYRQAIGAISMARNQFELPFHQKMAA